MSNTLDIGLFAKNKVRLVTQTAVAECGLACLAMVASYHGLEVDLATLRHKFRPSTRGITLKSLMQMSDQMGLSSRAVQLELEDLGALRMPAILHWDMAHFVVIEQVRSQKALIHDPGGSANGSHSKKFQIISRESLLS
ncbi:cysteine peptidase family C39 domain-containing protein [Parasphingorhabdus cellanae]|uniref:Peptidase C39 domain-containing protein n=1 Tax=Parasphingorhabdus cellanae TaxID=2806553 RepID=A0ABX7T5N7_9SPHN|nr:cysteine peptidase family C39 domain-containing protein [Parasphingorhabdus cellanae]QTD56903.1 hypothetical protein J4G78_04845 [Parasphingorhabdus cellanae]